MNLSSIHASDAARPSVAASVRNRPATADAPASPTKDEQAIADGLSALDGALDKGDLSKARKALAGIRTSAGLKGDASTSEADPLSEISSALGSDDLGAARKAWSDFRSALDDDDPTDYSVTVTRTATFSILA